MRVSKKSFLTILSLSLFVFSVSCSNEKTTGGGEAGGNGGSGGNSGGENVNLNPEAGKYTRLIGGPMEVRIEDGICRLIGNAFSSNSANNAFQIPYTNVKVFSWTKDDATGIISSTDIKRYDGSGDLSNMSARWNYFNSNNQKYIKLEFIFTNWHPTLLGYYPFTNQGIKVATVQ